MQARLHRRSCSSHRWFESLCPPSHTLQQCPDVCVNCSAPESRARVSSFEPRSQSNRYSNMLFTTKWLRVTQCRFEEHNEIAPNAMFWELLTLMTRPSMVRPDGLTIRHETSSKCFRRTSGRRDRSHCQHDPYCTSLQRQLPWEPVIQVWKLMTLKGQI